MSKVPLSIHIDVLINRIKKKIVKAPASENLGRVRLKPSWCMGGFYNGAVLRVRDEFRGLVSQHPNNPKVYAPGWWGSSVHPEDGGIVCFGQYLTEDAAVIVASDALNKRITFSQYKNEYPWGK